MSYAIITDATDLAHLNALTTPLDDCSGFGNPITHTVTKKVCYSNGGVVTSTCKQWEETKSGNKIEGTDRWIVDETSDDSIMPETILLVEPQGFVIECPCENYDCTLIDDGVCKETVVYDYNTPKGVDIDPYYYYRAIVEVISGSVEVVTSSVQTFTAGQTFSLGDWLVQQDVNLIVRSLNVGDSFRLTLRKVCGYEPAQADVIDGSAFVLGTSVTPGVSIDLSWVDVNAETGYRIFRKEVGGTYTLLATVGANVTTYSDTTAVIGTTYTYQIEAFNAAYNVFSNESSNVLTSTSFIIKIRI
jgi:hypothetical protein